MKIKIKVLSRSQYRRLPVMLRTEHRIQMRRLMNEAIPQPIEAKYSKVVIRYGGKCAPEYLYLEPFFNLLRSKWISDDAAIVLEPAEIFGFEIKLC